jgi:ribosomal protein S18 acetylase RimI-like enzyme
VDVTSLAYQTDLAVLQLGGTQVEDRGDYLVVRSAHNPTHWWGNFLLLAHPPVAEAWQWLDRFAAEFPTAEHVALGVDGTRGTATDLRWFADHGFTVDVSTVMTATAVHEPAHPNVHATCRTLSSPEDWAQSVELRMRCREPAHEPVAYRGYVTAQAQTNRRLADAGHGAWFGAFLDDRLVAQLGLVSTKTGVARFQSVETDPEYWRRGLAGSLVCHASRYGLDELGASVLVMVADPDYFAIDLYRAVGFSATETQLQSVLPPATEREFSGP